MWPRTGQFHAAIARAAFHGVVAFQRTREAEALRHQSARRHAELRDQRLAHCRRSLLRQSLVEFRRADVVRVALNRTAAERFPSCPQYVARPPDISNTAPVANEHSSLASQQISAAISVGSTKRFIGVLDSM